MAPLSAPQLHPEVLHAGDKIAYYSMAFVCGDPRGYREAIVLKVDAAPGADKPLDLDSGDIIAPTQMLKRLADRRGEQFAPGSALWRKLRTFTLVAGEYEAPTRASMFNRAVEEAVQQAFAAARLAEHTPREEIIRAVSEGIDSSSPLTVAITASDVSASSASHSGETSTPELASASTSRVGRVPCEDPQVVDAGVATALVSADSEDPEVAQAPSSTAEGGMQPLTDAKEPSRRGEGHACEKVTCSEERTPQHTGALGHAELVDLSSYLRSIPTRLKRAKIRHQAKKRPGSWHVPRSRKRRHQKKCAVTRSGANIYHAHTVRARTTKEALQVPGVKARLLALHTRRPKFGGPSTEPLDLAEEVMWPSSVRAISESQVPEGLAFSDIGEVDKCQCVGDCFMDSCLNALLSIYCTSGCCALGGACSNSPRSHPGLKLYDTARVELGVHTIAHIEVGDIVGEYVGRLFEYPAVIEGQPPQAIKQNSGYTMLLNAQSLSGKYVYIEALNCGSITRFMSHSCDPNVEFVEMQNGANVKVLARMIKTVLPGTQLTVNYGDEIWFKCACDSCWIDPYDEEE